MSRKTTVIEQLMQVTSCREFQEKSNNWSADLTLPEAQKLTRYIQTLEPVKYKLKLGVIHTYTSELLAPWLEFHAAVQGIELNTYHAPYGMNLSDAQLGSDLFNFKPDLTLFMLRREDLHPKLSQPITGLNKAQQDCLREETVLRLLDILSPFRENVSGRFLLTILPSQFGPGLGLYDAQSKHSESAWWANFKRSATKVIGMELESTLFMDLDEILADLGRNSFFDPRFWHTSRFPFKPSAANEFCRKLLALASVTLTPKAKVIILDADNTLWGGVIGEEGIHGISLGPDYPGNAYVDFQRRILDYQERGFILAMCSKNNEQDVFEVLRDHPHQILRESHFSALRINWQPKHENLVSLAKELNLGLDSFIFVDDSDYECGIVRRELPQVHVVQTPTKPTEIPSCLDRISRLEIINLTEEDQNKTRMYAEDRQRRDLQKEVHGDGVERYLASLNMEMKIELNASSRISRLAQLTQKTNQFNLTTRRYSEKQIQEFIEADDWLVACFSLSDIFGDSGIVGLALIHNQNTMHVRIDTLLMSCRVIGRNAESAFIEGLMEYLASKGVDSVSAEYIPTLKNTLTAKFYLNHQFSQYEDHRYSRSLKNNPPLSIDTFSIKQTLIYL